MTVPIDRLKQLLDGNGVQPQPGDAAALLKRSFGMVKEAFQRDALPATNEYDDYYDAVTELARALRAGQQVIDSLKVSEAFKAVGQAIHSQLLASQQQFAHESAQIEAAIEAFARNQAELAELNRKLTELSIKAPTAEQLAALRQAITDRRAELAEAETRLDQAAQLKRREELLQRWLQQRDDFPRLQEHVAELAGQFNQMLQTLDDDQRGLLASTEAQLREIERRESAVSEARRLSEEQQWWLRSSRGIHQAVAGQQSTADRLNAIEQQRQAVDSELRQAVDEHERIRRPPAR